MLPITKNPSAEVNIPPQNIDAEEAILGGILLDPEAIARVVDILSPEVFYIKAHSEIYAAAVTLHSQDQPTDFMTVSNWLQDRNLLEELGGNSKLAQLVDRTVSAVNIDRYAIIIKEKFLKRQIISLGYKLAETESKTTVEEDLESLQNQLEKITRLLSDDQNQEKRTEAAEALKDAFGRMPIYQVLHPYLAKIITEAADALPVPYEYIAQHFFAICAGLIGTKATVQVKRGWKEGCGFWGGVVAPPGASKTPALKVVQQPLVAMQAKAEEEYQYRLQEYQSQLSCWEAMDKKERAGIEKPTEPEARDYYVDRWTMEGLLEAHSKQINATGFVAIRDELAGLFLSLDQYKGKGDDRQILLGLWSGNSDKVNRVGKRAFISKTAVSITGGIQPDVLLKLMSNTEDEDGLWGRFLWSNPPVMPDTFNDKDVDISPALAAIYQELDRLPDDCIYRLSDSAKRIFGKFVDKLSSEKADCGNAMKNIMGKMKGYAARIALLLHCMDLAAEPTAPFVDVISKETMERAIALCEYYLSQSRTLYQRSQPIGKSNILSALFEKVIQFGKQKLDWISSTLLVQKKWFKTAKAARETLSEIAEMGFGEIRKVGAAIEWRFLEKAVIVQDSYEPEPEQNLPNLPEQNLPNLPEQNLPEPSPFAVGDQVQDAIDTEKYGEIRELKFDNVRKWRARVTWIDVAESDGIEHDSWVNCWELEKKGTLPPIKKEFKVGDRVRPKRSKSPATIIEDKKTYFLIKYDAGAEGTLSSSDLEFLPLEDDPKEKARLLFESLKPGQKIKALKHWEHKKFPRRTDEIRKLVKKDNSYYAVTSGALAFNLEAVEVL